MSTSYASEKPASMRRHLRLVSDIDLQRAEALHRAARRSRQTYLVLRTGLELDHGVAARDLAEQIGVPLATVRLANSALRRMGFAACPQAGPSGVWFYSVTR